MIDANPKAVEPIPCPNCGEDFEPRRKNQSYCSRCCQKNAARGARIKEMKAMNQKHFAILDHLNHLVFAAPRVKQLGAMKRILDTATEQDISIRAVYGDSTSSGVAPKIWKVSPADIRRLLTDPRLLKANRYNEAHDHLFYGQRPKTISQAAHAYTVKFFGVSIREYLDARCGGPVEGIPQVKPSGQPERQFKVIPRSEMFLKANGFPDIFPPSWAEAVEEFTKQPEPTSSEKQGISDIFESIVFECGDEGLINWLRFHKLPTEPQVNIRSNPNYA